MRFLVDENIPAAVLKWLRSENHDVLSASELAAGESDANWLSLAESDRRIIVTSDKDFGELIFRDRLNGHGVILLRLEDLLIPEWLVRLQEVWSIIQANPTGRFIVVNKNRIRVRRL